MFSLQDSNADETFTMDLHNFEVDDTEEIADIPPADSPDVNEEHPAESEPTQSQETTGMQSTIQTAASTASTPQHLYTVAAKRQALDHAHLYYFTSTNRLNMRKIEHYKCIKEQQKQAANLQKLKEKKSSRTWKLASSISIYSSSRNTGCSWKYSTWKMKCSSQLEVNLYQHQQLDNADILCAAANNENIMPSLTTVWCKPF